jgi:very-short-patch-repair endonuclease
MRRSVIPSPTLHNADPFPKGGKQSVIINESRLGGFLCVQQERPQYRADLKQKARTLRARMTDAEQLLWFHLRRKQIAGVQFFRQRPVGEFILDFYAPSIRLAIEVDGGQHLDAVRMEADKHRTASLGKFGIMVIRFDNFQVLKETGVVLEEVHRVICDRKSPSVPL